MSSWSGDKQHEDLRRRRHRRSRPSGRQSARRGPGTPSAAGLAAKADAGEILVADTVRGCAAARGSCFADRGEFVAKGFEEPMRVYGVTRRAH
jgi:class 3 adenylate cyclase